MDENNLVSQLELLANLHDSGAITDSEFTMAKARLLSGEEVPQLPPSSRMISNGDLAITLLLTNPVACARRAGSTSFERMAEVAVSSEQPSEWPLTIAGQSSSWRGRAWARLV